jgi:hypothetical protein
MVTTCRTAKKYQIAGSMLDRKISKTQNLTFFLNDVWYTLSTNVDSQIAEVGGMRIHT